MTSDNSVKTITHKGVTCKSDMGLYLDGDYNKTVFILSVYGASQQVKAIFSAFSLGNNILLDKTVLTRDWSTSIRFKGRSLGYGRYHGMLWTDDIKDHVIWTVPEERIKALQSALSRRPIPFDKQWLPEIEVLLLRNNFLTELKGWGGISGYRALWDDDAVCDAICEEIKKGTLAA